jgi:hypothetical protein
MATNLIHCDVCREPFVITDNGVTCGCPGPIRDNTQVPHSSNSPKNTRSTATTEISDAEPAHVGSAQFPQTRDK